jgi:hypothetical protein
LLIEINILDLLIPQLKAKIGSGGIITSVRGYKNRKLKSKNLATVGFEPTPCKGCDTQPPCKFAGVALKSHVVTT